MPPSTSPHEKTGFNSKGENGGKKASLGFVVTWSESQLSLVSCPSSPSEIIEETAESGFNDKTLPHEEQSEVPDGRGSAPSKRQTIDTRTTSLYTSTILALSTGVTPTAKRKFARLFTRCLSRHTFTLLCIHTITQLRNYAFTYNCFFFFLQRISVALTQFFRFVTTSYS